ncbi:unnamed protein product [Heligmosomoides polygyrus]|uniref:Uncharacterized protein n=1 Tax=Heligmosomoides polygyrus TaxID=6339 RepID=A0A183G0Q6_HELPZ|nr:unnamed protein product [Heligmosomoides polygyrus]
MSPVLNSSAHDGRRRRRRRSVVSGTPFDSGLPLNPPMLMLWSARRRRPLYVQAFAVVRRRYNFNDVFSALQCSCPYRPTTAVLMCFREKNAVFTHAFYSYSYQFRLLLTQANIITNSRSVVAYSSVGEVDISNPPRLIWSIYLPSPMMMMSLAAPSKPPPVLCV